MNTTIQIRIKKSIKEKARKKFEEVGIDLSSGIRSILSDIAISNEPLRGLRTVNGFTVEYEKKLRRESDYAMKHGKSYKNSKELVDDILRK